MGTTRSPVPTGEPRPDPPCHILAVAGYITNAAGEVPLVRTRRRLVDNERARRLYERHGFVIEGRRRSSLIAGGEFKDEWLMARYRAEPAGGDPAGQARG